MMKQFASAGLVNDDGSHRRSLNYTHPTRRCRVGCAKDALRFSRFGRRVGRILESELAGAAVQLWLVASTGAKTASSRKLG